MDQIMKVQPIEKEGPKLNTLERYHIYIMTKRGLQMNDIFTDLHSPIYEVLIKTHNNPSHYYTHSTNPPPTHTSKPHIVYIHTRTPSTGSSDTTTTTGNCVYIQKPYQKHVST
jgi:hypothetical protein